MPISSSTLDRGDKGNAQRLDIQVLLNYDLAPCSCHLGCVLYKQACAITLKWPPPRPRAPKKQQALASLVRDVGAPRSASEGSSAVLHPLRSNTMSNCRTYHVKTLCVRCRPRCLTADPPYEALPFVCHRKEWCDVDAHVQCTLRAHDETVTKP